MARYSSVIWLVDIDYSVDNLGVHHEERTERMAYANRFDMSLSNYAQAKSVGLHADAEYQLRSCDYHGEEVVRIGETDYTVERVADSGEFTRLTLKKGLKDG